MGELNQTPDAIIAQALANAGVPAQNIDISPVVEESAPSGLPTLDGQPKPASKGELPVEAVAEAEATPAVVLPTPGEPTEQPLSKSDIEAAVAKASSSIQGLMDRKINQLQYQMTQTIGALNQFFQTQEDTSMAGLSGEDQVAKRLERLEQGGAKSKIQIATQPELTAQQQVTLTYQRLADIVVAVGIKMDDKRIDWAPDVSVDNFEAGFTRFKASLTKAVTEDQTNLIKKLKEDGGKEITKLRKKVGVDKVAIGGPGGPGLADVSKMTPMQKIEYGFKQQEELSQVSQ